MKDRSACNGARCMESGCKIRVPEELFRVMLDGDGGGGDDGAQLDKYFAWRAMAISRPGSTLAKACTRPGCELFVLFSVDKRTVRCRCDNEFCFSCGEDAHTPATCDQVKNWAKRDKGADATLDKIPESLREKIKKVPGAPQTNHGPRLQDRLLTHSGIPGTLRTWRRAPLSADPPVMAVV